MSNKENPQSIGAVEWTLVILFFVIVVAVYWGLKARNDLLIGYVMPIGLIVVICYLGIRYLFEQRAMLKAIKEFQKHDDLS
ncbi:hypothetical protein [Candidatus Formimonas warabiya]|uniref:C4-dicarboxylate ABC transporter n=1 Tax=Formimonas warabiya TaxID=1761012 RepID=A0A3G1KVR7_FORW1|nr:hypothetical protein [Candidatus Formimonas warabiya]ATW26500.1 hypothetical protein DCMF_18645 [Candidatus Formimonas warabiya]